MTNIKQQLLSGLGYIASLDFKLLKASDVGNSLNKQKERFESSLQESYATISVVKVVQDIISSIFLDTFYSKFINKSTVTKLVLISGKWRVYLYSMVGISNKYAGTVQHALVQHVLYVLESVLIKVFQHSYKIFLRIVYLDIQQVHR